jgi:hypothetical protein
MIIENISKETQAPKSANADQRSALADFGGIRFKHFSINM